MTTIRPKSPVTVQEWAAALPDHSEEGSEKDDIEHENTDEEDKKVGGRKNVLIW